MTDIERKMRHGERPTITFDGIHVIECPKGCSMHDAEHAEPDALMLRWDQSQS